MSRLFNKSDKRLVSKYYRKQGRAGPGPAQRSVSLNNGCKFRALSEMVWLPESSKCKATDRRASAAPLFMRAGGRAALLNDFHLGNTSRLPF